MKSSFTESPVKEDLNTTFNSSEEMANQLSDDQSPQKLQQKHYLFEEALGLTDEDT